MQAYLEGGWLVEIFPLVVGIRGLLDSGSIKRSLKFLPVTV